MRTLSDLPKLRLVPMDLRLVSPQAEMDPEVGRIATFRITETREDEFELGVSRYITLGHRFSAFLVTHESAEPHGAEQRSCPRGRQYCWEPTGSPAGPGRNLAVRGGVGRGVL